MAPPTAPADLETDPFALYGGLTEKQLTRARRIQERVATDKSLGEVLLELGEITQEEYDQVQQSHRAQLDLVDVLVDQGALEADRAAQYRAAKASHPYASDFDLLVEAQRVPQDVFFRALAQKDQVAFVEPSPHDVDREVLERASMPYLRRLGVLPVCERDGSLELVSAGPLDPTEYAELEQIFRLPLDVRYSTKARIAAALETLERRSGEDQAVATLEYRASDDATLRSDATGRETVRAVDNLLLSAIKLGASDVHIQPTADRLCVRARVDGRVRPVLELPKEMAPRLASRIKVLAGADISERRLHQDGKIFVKTEQGEVDIRVSSYVSVHGENIVLRLLDRNRGLVPLSKLGFAPKVESVVTDVILPSASGLVLITGPTGSGKTTTLYSLMQHNLDPEEIVISAEDPVEYVIEGIVQCSVNEKTGPTFVDSLRSMVRQDPDTIIVGEIRDTATVKMAFESALTGHQVFSTFHTENSVAAIIRLLEMGVAPFLVSSTLSAVVAQRLVRRVCSHCAAPIRLERKELKYLGMQRSSLEGIELWGGSGCDRCEHSGYAGRVGIHEVLVPNDEFRDAVLRRAPAKELEVLARKSPHFMTLQEDGMLKAVQKLTSVSELISSVPRDLQARPLADLRAVAGLRRTT